MGSAPKPPTPPVTPPPPAPMAPPPRQPIRQASKPSKTLSPARITSMASALPKRENTRRQVGKTGLGYGTKL